jgi:hypothetical protein
MSSNAAFTTILLDLSLTATDYTSGPLSPGSYFWRVFAVDQSGFQLSSVASSFTASGSTVGTMNAIVGLASPPNSNQLNTAQDLPVLQLRFMAGPNEDIRITSLILTGFGTGNETTHLQGVRLFADTNSDGQIGSDQLLGGPTSYFQDDGTVAFGSLNVIVPASQSRDLLLAYSLNGTAPIGTTFAARLAQSTHVNAVGMTSATTILPSGSFPLNGGTVTVVTSGSAGGLNVSRGVANPADGFISASEQTVEMTQIRFAASSVEAVQVTNLVVRAAGSGNDLTDLALVYLAIDLNGNGIFNAGSDPIIGSGSFSADNGTASFAMTQTIAAGQSISWLVVYDMSGIAASGSVFTVELRPTTPGEITVTGLSSGAAITPSGPDFFGAVKTVGVSGTDPGSIAVSNVSLPDPPLVLPIARGITMLAFDLATGGLEGVVVQQVRVKGSGSGNEASDILRAQLWEDANGDGQFSTADVLIASLQNPFAQNDGEASFSLAHPVPPSALRRWFMTYDLSGAATEGSFFQASFDLQSVPAPIAATGVLSSKLITATGGLLVGPQVRVRALVGSSGNKKSCLASTAAEGPLGSALPGALAAAFLLLLMVTRRR